MSERLAIFPPSFLELRSFGILRDIDLYLTESLLRRFCADTHNTPSPPTPAILLATCLANRVIQDNHICLHCPSLTPTWLAGLARSSALSAKDVPEEVRPWLEQIRTGHLQHSSSPLIGRDTDSTPFVLFQDRLYLRRYWQYEQQVVQALLARAQQAGGPTRSPLAHPAAEPDALQLNEQQQQAVAVAGRTGLTIISGGPGTGKTHTAARILYLLARSHAGQRPPVIRMAAPTGKAADRLNESVQQALQSLDTALATPAANSDPSAAATAPSTAPILLPEPACTLERLLGYQSDSPYFRHHRENPLPADVVLIDEASMVDLPRMAKLLDALTPSCRLILLGDMHQLASVAPGSVLGDICQADALRACVVELTESRRFMPGGIVDTISKAILSTRTPEQARTTWELLQAQCARQDATTRFAIDCTPASWLQADASAHPGFAADIIRGYAAFTQARTPAVAFEALSSFRVLCAMRHGPHGIHAINAHIEQILAGTALEPAQRADATPQWTRIQPTGAFYDHRVIMITRNDYSMQLFNGDVGIIMPATEEKDRLVAWFPPRRGTTTYRQISCRLLPQHETAFAITIHKAQGSEFDNIAVILPDRPSPVVTKELVYTALTRTRAGIKLWCEPAAFQQAILSRVERASGLQSQLDLATSPGHRARP